MEDLTFTISGQHIAATSRVVIASGTYGHLHALGGAVRRLLPDSVVEFMEEYRTGGNGNGEGDGGTDG